MAAYRPCAFEVMYRIQQYLVPGTRYAIRIRKITKTHIPKPFRGEKTGTTRHRSFKFALQHGDHGKLETA